MLVIRFNRVGKRNLAYFRVVLQERTQAPGKRHVEILGSYDPHKKSSVLQKERILYWIGKGAQPSPVVHNFLIREGILAGTKIAKKMPRPAVKEELKEAPAVAETKPEVKTEEAQTSAETEVPTEVKKEEVPAQVTESASVAEEASEESSVQAEVAEEV